MTSPLQRSAVYKGSVLRIAHLTLSLVTLKPIDLNHPQTIVCPIEGCSLHMEVSRTLSSLSERVPLTWVNHLKLYTSPVDCHMWHSQHPGNLNPRKRHESQKFKLLPCYIKLGSSTLPAWNQHLVQHTMMCNSVAHTCQCVCHCCASSLKHDCNLFSFIQAQ